MATPDRLVSVEIAMIVPRDDVVNRAINHDAVAELVESIKDCGLNTPIRVRPISKYKSGVRTDAWELIAGQHRLEACRQLGWSHIDANAEDVDDVTAELAMIDENLRRSDLDPPYRMHVTARRKFLYGILHPETEVGATGGRGGKTKFDFAINAKSKTGPADRFTKATAKATGRAERSIQLDAQIGKELGADILKTAGTSLGTVTELKALAEIKDGKRRADLIARAAAGEKVSARPASQPVPPKTAEPAPPQPPLAPASPTATANTEDATITRLLHEIRALSAEQRERLFFELQSDAMFAALA